MNTPKQQIFVASEVATHDSREDCWLSIFGRVLDITGLIAENHGALAEPLILAAGEDVSHWFVRDSDGLPDLRTFIDPATNVKTPYCPAGRFLHVPAVEPTTTLSLDYLTAGGPWWRNPSLVVGSLSNRPRMVRVINTLTSHDHTLQVAAECSISDIQAKYLEHNAHSGAYTWKALVRGEFRPLDMGDTLEGNEVDGAGEGKGSGGHEDLQRLGMDPEDGDLIPALMLYFNDDLTVA